MGEKIFNKLVRDGIPEIIRQSGETPEVRILDEEEYKLELAKKLVEEARELEEAIAAGDRDAAIEELADVDEVRRALIAAYAFTREEVEAERMNKLEARGGFEAKQFLERTTPLEEKQ